jgi:hypothetical protein
MPQHLRCASPSDNFGIRNTVTVHQGAISRSWIVALRPSPNETVTEIKLAELQSPSPSAHNSAPETTIGKIAGSVSVA